MTKAVFKLPPALIGRAHISQLIRELESVENDLERQKARAKSKTLKMPILSRALGDCTELNDVDLMDGQARMRFKQELGRMKDKAPTMHFTFATEPDGESLQRLTNWIRTEVHPQALVSVGLQPALVGGAYLRTPNHVHDFSLRRLLHDKRDVITQALEARRESVTPGKAGAEAAKVLIPVPGTQNHKPATGHKK